MQRDLAGLARKEYDLLVIGGGIYGVFVAWDAALRGLSVAMIEKGDFGHATSSNTLRIIHGGLRYLQYGDIRRVRRSIAERTAFMRIAPHLVHPLPFLIPTYGHWRESKALLSLALLVNEIIGFDRNRLADPQKHLPRSRVISRKECLQLFPGVNEDGLTGGVIYYDCQMYDSERLIVSISRSAARAGADMANYVEVTGLLRDGARLNGVTARDVITEDTLDIRARMVVNTSGPWTNQLLRLLNVSLPNPAVALSKAFNLLVSRQLVPDFAVGVYGQARHADQVQIVNHGHRIFLITPWRKHSLIGTAHLPYDADPDSFEITDAEIQAFLDQINEAWPAAGLKREEVRVVFGGLLPVVADACASEEVKLVRHYHIHDHQKEEGIEGLISVVGVKFTEARLAAERAVNLVFRKLGRRPVQSPTAVTAIYGGNVGRFDDFLAAQIKQRPEGLDAEIMRDIAYRYGSDSSGVLKYLEEDADWEKSTSSGALVNVDSARVVKAEVRHAIRHEMAQKLTDVVFRRTELGTFRDPGEACLRDCVSIMVEELGWDEARTQRELEEVKAVFSLRT